MCSQDTRDAAYQEIETYLETAGFVSAAYEEGPLTSAGHKHQAIEVYEDGYKIRSVLASLLVNAATGEEATLRYGVSAQGETSSFALVYRDGTPQYTLFVDPSGQLTMLLPEESGAPSTAPASYESAIAAESTPVIRVRISNLEQESINESSNQLCGICGPLCWTTAGLGCGLVGIGVAVPFIPTGPVGAYVGWGIVTTLVGVCANEWQQACMSACHSQNDLVARSTTNCGSCGHPCESAQSCCTGHCIDTRSDQSNCGACGFENACGPGEACIGGICGPCQHDHQCGANQICVGNVCQQACQSNDDCDASKCEQCSTYDGRCYSACDSHVVPRTCCGGECKSLSSDDKNCGACGIECALNEHCYDGVCKDACTTSFGEGHFLCENNRPDSWQGNCCRSSTHKCCSDLDFFCCEMPDGDASTGCCSVNGHPYAPFSRCVSAEECASVGGTWVPGKTSWP